MPKQANLGNGSVLIGMDKYGQVKDLYFHYAGLENHVSEHLVHKIGIFVEDRFTWIDDPSWNVEVGTEPDSMASKIIAKNEELGLELQFSDILYNEVNIFIREVTIHNKFSRSRKVKVYFNQQFNISQSSVGDTAYFDPRENVIIHYKGRRVFLVNAYTDRPGFDSYSVGLFGIEGKAGTYVDAEDGHLNKNPIEHGQVDSVIEIGVDVESESKSTIYYWMTIAKSIERAKKLNDLVLSRHPSDIIKTTKDYWKAWVYHQNFSFYGLPQSAIDLFNRSLINIRTHVNKNGSIIASGDSGLLQFGRDTYSYVWPRDGAFCAIALEKAGDFNASKRFFKFCNSIITSEGYFMHKYRPDKSLGSSWHPWVRDGKKQYPIQEDETALVLCALWEHYDLTKDLEFIETIYNSLIKKAAEFMTQYLDDKTGLPKASYDLWEENYIISTFTASTVYGALTAASNFAKLLGKNTAEIKYKKVAEAIRESILKYLYDKEREVFYKSISFNEKGQFDKTLDMSSIYGIYRFGVLPLNDVKLKKAMEKYSDRLTVDTEIGGIARYEGDSYQFKGGDVPGNPWIITSMWEAQYYCKIAKNEGELEKTRKWIMWTVNHAARSGVLPEQLDPYTGEHVSATPLIWSHAEYVTTIINYLEKLEELGICKACYPLNR